jgi:hypothetical protein
MSQELLKGLRNQEILTAQPLLLHTHTLSLCVGAVAIASVSRGLTFGRLVRAGGLRSIVLIALRHIMRDIRIHRGGGLLLRHHALIMFAMLHVSL